MAQQNATNPEVNLNNANVESLATLPGVTDELAQSIVARREEKPFETVDDVKSVEGVSDELFDQLQTLVTVADSDAAGDEGAESGDEQAGETPVEDTEEDGGSTGETDDDVVVGDEAIAGEAVVEPSDDAGVDKVPVPGESDTADEVAPTDSPTFVDNADETEESTSEDSDGYVINWPGEAEEGKEVEESALQPAADSVDTPEAEPQPAPVPQPAPAAPAKSAESFRRPWLLMLVGTLLGAFVALGALYLINDGVLVFANHPKVTQLETALANLEQREATLNEKISELQDELTVLSSMKNLVETNQTEIRKLRQAEETLTEQLTLVDERSTVLEERASEVEDRVSTQGKDISSLQLTTNKLDDALQEVEEDAARFDGFLEGLRELLIQSQE